MGLPTIATRRAAFALAAVACGAVLGLSPSVASAAPTAPVTPSDTLYADQSALQADAAIGAPQAWRLTRGAGAVVAVLDTGVLESHPDLTGQLWTNSGEVAGNGKDDDRNGYVDDVHGVDLVNRDGDPADDEGHGTHIAGIIAAKADGDGAVGLANQAKIMAIKVLDARRGGTADTVAQGVLYAVGNGADVINISINGAGTSESLKSAIRIAGAAGVPVVASAGNDGDNLGLVPSYPASYPDAAVVGVGATKGDTILASFSNFGRGVELTAPGVGILSTSSTGGYELRDGTSMAAPFVAAALAMLHSVRPELAGTELQATLEATARHPSNLLGKVAAGAIDVAAALRSLVPEDQWPTQADPPVLTARVKRTTSGRSGRALITWTLTGDVSQVSRYRVTLGGKTLARRSGGGARGLYVPRRKGRATLVALSSTGARIAVARVTIK
ncbi:S8 family peptidase [Paraconexibacter sp. AEG42_29]